MKSKQLNIFDFNQIPFFLFLAYAYSLVLGPLITELIVLLIISYYLIWCFKKKHLSDFQSKFFLFFIAFFIYLNLLSIFLSKDISLSLKNSLFYFRHGLFALSIIWLLNRNKKNIELLKRSLLLLVFILSVDGFNEAIFGENLFGFKNVGRPDRLSGLFFDELILGSFLSKIIPILIGLNFISESKAYEKKIFWIIIVLSYLLVFLTGERTAFLLLNLFFVLFLLLIFDLKKIFIILAATVITLSFFLNFDSRIYERYKETVEKQIIVKDSKTNKLIVFPYYFEHFHISINMFKSSPIFGLGPKSFRVECKNSKFKDHDLNLKPWGDGCTTHPHNYYIQLLAETGIIGFAIIMMFYIRILLNYFKLLLIKINFKKKKYVEAVFVCNTLTLLWPIIPTGNFFNNWISSLLFFSLAFYLNYSDNKLLDSWKTIK